jgi:2,5-furandicarboxylate decarboxylase 1
VIDLHSFLDTHRRHHLHVEKTVPLDHVPALTAEAEQTIVFDDIQDFPGWRLVDQLFVDRASQARVLGCAPTDVVAELSGVLQRGPRPLIEIDDAPCQEIVVEGEDVDLSTLPIVTHTDLDPYPYTTSFAIHRDPETGQGNQMFPRCGVLGGNEMVASFVTSTANRILGKYQAAGEMMPQAIVIGAHPAWELAGCYSHPHDDWWELELFEAISGQPGEVVRCRTVDLVVPADASLVIEGYVDPDRRAPDGPSPGPTMLFTPRVSQQPVFVVTAITRRGDPIYRNHLMTPFTDHQEMPRLFHEAIIYERLSAMGVGIRDVHFPQGGGALLCVIQVEPRMDGQVTDALLSVMGSTWINTKMVVAVDPDIDIYDYRDLQYAMAVRVDPSRDVIVVPNTRGLPFDPTARPVIGAMPDTEQSRFPSVAARWGIDATKPVPYRPERADYERAWPKGWGEVSLADYVESN